MWALHAAFALARVFWSPYLSNLLISQSLTFQNRLTGQLNSLMLHFNKKLRFQYIN